MTPQNAPTKVLGQPTHFSHPHLLNEGEIAPFLTKSEFQTRRAALVEQIFSYVSKKVGNQTKSHFVSYLQDAL